jgi:PAS domain S-box-containing protein
MNTASIFIVEDEIITAQGIAKHIEKLGYQVAGIATSGTHALVKIANQQPDLILMDIRLKRQDIDGITAASQIKEKFNIPVIYLTAHSDEATLERAKETEPFGYLLKPYSQKRLKISIQMALHKHQKEKELIAQKELLSNIINASPKGVIATNKTEAITYMNVAAENLTGWNKTEAFGQQAKDVIKIIDQRTNTPIPIPIQEVLDSGRVVYFEEDMVLIAKDGYSTSIVNSVFPLRKYQDITQGAVLIFSDFNQDQLANSLEKDNYEEIFKAERQLSELRSQLLNIITHQFRSPLTIILSSSEFLRRYSHKLTVKKKEAYCDRILKSVYYINQLLDDIVVLQQASTGKLDFRASQTEIITFCQELITGITLNTLDKQRFLIAHNGEEIIVWIDRNLVGYILSNLFSNAIKYSHPQSQILFSLEYQNKRLIFKIEDQGIGIPKDELNLLFESFYRASNVADIPGTGLGLTIVKFCLDIHRGEIKFESEIGVGTTVTVSLPCTE